MGLKQKILEVINGKPEDPSVEHLIAVQDTKAVLSKALDKKYDAVIIIGRTRGELEVDSVGFDNDEAEYWLGKAWHKAQHKGLL
jgi:DNA-binding LacI/PurR family transcriptional regulator